MPRYKLTIEYDGTGIMGWQRQKHGPSIQQYMEEAITAFCGEQVTIYCAGRTDSGVHACGQVAHIDIARDSKPYTVMQAINYHLLPQRIAITKIDEVDEAFHARFSATGRHYMYRIINRPARVALEQSRAYHVPQPLDIARMQEAAALLVGTHDFSSFRDSMCQAKSPVKTLWQLDVERIHDEEVRLYASAPSFLHHQVRNLTGSLIYVGTGKWSIDDLIAAKEACSRPAGGPTAPAHGLYFMKVDY